MQTDRFFLLFYFATGWRAIRQTKHAPYPIVS
jgi:hypothetical protein